jgi:pyruvate,orthophosphate dikinase
MGVDDDSFLTGEHMQEVVRRFKNLYAAQGVELPKDVKSQLELAVGKVLDSWDNQRSREYRAINDIMDCSATAINVQAMVFGNLGPTSGTGVLFSRNPSTGENHLYGEFLLDAQGEDVVAGFRTPSPIAVLEAQMPEVYAELLTCVEKLERHFGDMQDIEFTIQDKKLFLLQCRTGKRTGQAAVRIAVEMFNQGAMSKAQAINKVQDRHLDQLLHPQFADEQAYAERVVGRGLPASPGAAVGQVVFSAEEAMMLRAQGGAAILVRGDTAPEDVGGMHASEGILTQRGGMTSHAAVVARGWGKTCVVGCMEMMVDDRSKSFSLGGKTFKAGDWISLNGNSGEVIDGKEPLSPPILVGDLSTFMSWVDEKRRMLVYANADTPEDAAEARRNGAQGIGLVRTEHMFYSSEDRLKAVRTMIMADTSEQRTEALSKLLPYQRADFEGIFRAMGGTRSQKYSLYNQFCRIVRVRRGCGGLLLIIPILIIPINSLCPTPTPTPTDGGGGVESPSSSFPPRTRTIFSVDTRGRTLEHVLHRALQAAAECVAMTGCRRMCCYVDDRLPQNGLSQAT